MKRSLFSLACVCALLMWGSDRGPAKALASSRARPVTESSAKVSPGPTDQARGGGEYYIDCGAAGEDGDGRSPKTAWHSLDKANGHLFAPGDVIYLKRGTQCRGLLWPKGSGSASAVIRLSAYGTGTRPKLIAGKGDEEAFKLYDQEYWDVDSIDFSGGTIFGVLVSGHTGILHHIHLRNLLVHDVHGREVQHKESGLVVISPGEVQQHFDDVLVEGVTAYRTEQWAGILVGGGNFGEVTEENWSTHVIVRNSVVHDVYGDGIILFRVKDGLIDLSAAWNTGMQPTQSIGTPNAIWTWMCKDCTVRRSEAFLTDSPGVDGGAFDIDYGNTRNSVLDNYGHDTQGYCVAVFGAGYVTRESVVEGNLCINNGESPRMARYQGALFLLTWNAGVIENLRVERNTIYWRPPGNFPAVLNRADLQGGQKIFRENQIYSRSSRVVESNKELSFQDNRYITCETKGATWIFNNHTYGSFDEFRAATGEDQGGTWKSEKAPALCLGQERSPVAERRNEALASKGAAAPDTTPPAWTVVSRIPASLDAQGLLDAASAGQLLVLKNLYLQFRSSGLRMSITLDWKQPGAGESLQNVIRDLAMNEVNSSESPGQERLSRPRTLLVAPDESVAKEWQDFFGPAEIGLAVRSVLGEPEYSQMKSEEDLLPH